MSASETSLLVCVDDVTAGRNDSRWTVIRRTGLYSAQT